MYRYKSVLLKEDTATDYNVLGKSVRNDIDVFSLLKSIYADVMPDEHMWVIHLDIKSNIVGFSEVSIGAKGKTIADPSAIFRDAILGNSNAVILAHNHPSGSLEPSKEDIETTQRLCDAGKILGIEIKDHLIVSHGEYISMLGKGLMEVA